jgi:hypothetical protein
MQVDLNTVNTQIQQAMPLIKAGTQVMNNAAPGEFEWLDKIANMLDKVTQFAKLYQEQARPASPQSQGDQQTIPRDLGITELPPQPLHPQQIATPQQENKMNMIMKVMIPIIEAHLDNCIKINPKMSAGEVIARIDFLDVTELKKLLNDNKAKL